MCCSCCRPLIWFIFSRYWQYSSTLCYFLKKTFNDLSRTCSTCEGYTISPVHCIKLMFLWFYTNVKQHFVWVCHLSIWMLCANPTTLMGSCSLYFLQHFLPFYSSCFPYPTLPSPIPLLPPFLPGFCPPVSPTSALVLTLHCAHNLAHGL